MLVSPKWVKKAYCVGANPEIFDDSENEETAKAYCQRCTVVVECLAWALTQPDASGVWGGTSETERRALKRGGERASCPGCGGFRLYSDGSSEICLACGLSWLT